MKLKTNKCFLKFLFTICCIFLLIPINFQNVQASSSIQGVTEEYTFGSDYGFTFKYTEGVTSITTGSGYTYLPKGGEYKWDFKGDFSTSNIWARYNNVGLYEGQIVDLKISLIAKDKVNGTDQYVSLSKFMEVRFKNVVNPQFKFQFFKHGTDTEMNIKGSMTFSDVDDGQGIQILNGTSNMYYLSDYNWLYQSGDMLLSREHELSENPDKKAWITTTYENSLVMRYLCPDRVDDAPYFGYSANAISGYDTPSLYKNISNTNVHNSDEFTYNLSFSMPFISSQYYYNSLQIIDDIPSILDVSLEKITLTNETGASVNNKFSTTLINNQLKIQMNNPSTDTSLYGHDYKITIVAKKKSGEDVSPYKNYVPNTASITTNKGTKISNTVYNKFNHNITTSVTNGTITQGKEGVDATTNYTISYVPSDSDRYILDSVTVNNTAVDVNTYPNSYTINNINNDYSISVNYKRVYVIDTSINNTNGGTITSRITKINGGENKNIDIKVNDGYYIESLIVDGENIPYEYSKYKNKYTFNNINEDHSIQVIFKPYMTANIQKILLDENLNELKNKENFEALGLSTNKDYKFYLTISDLTTGETHNYTYKNNESFNYGYLKAGHTYTITERKYNPIFNFYDMNGQDTSFISGIKPEINMVKFTVNNNSTIPETYNILSRSTINTERLIVEEVNSIISNLFKLIK